MSWQTYRKIQNFFCSNKKEAKDGNGSIVTISYKIKLIDSARFMTTLLSNLVDNFTV